MSELIPNLFTHRTLRVRLTLWYVLLMGLMSVLFSGYLYVRLNRSLIASIDVALVAVISQTFTGLDNEKGSNVFENMEDIQTVTSALEKKGFVIRLLNPEGRIMDGFNAYPHVPLWVPTSQGFVTKSGAKEEWRIYSQPIKTKEGGISGWLQAAAALGFVQKTVSNMRTQLLIGLPLMLLFAGIGGVFLANRALKPIDRVTRTAQSMSINDLSRRIDFRGPDDEVGRLAGTFDRMLDRLQAAFDQERRFTGDAAHELRTPLTVLKGQIEVTLNKSRTIETYQRTLKNLGQEVDRLIRLSNDLLFLSRFDQGHLSWTPAVLNINELLLTTLEQIQQLAEAKRLSLHTEIAGRIAVYGDLDQLIRLFLNLFDNAVKYTPEGGRISVRARREDAEVRIDIGNTGPGIPAEHIPHLFQRFYRVGADRSRVTGGAGLGLAIVYEIICRHHGTIEVSNQPQGGTQFTLHLPLQNR